MKLGSLVILYILGISFHSYGQNASSTLSKINRLQGAVLKNQDRLTSAELREINQLVDQALGVAGSQSGQGSGGGYLECRKAGYLHSDCDQQGPAYVECRKAGYLHSDCDQQSAAYLQCRRAGYLHSDCNRQRSAYLECRKAGYLHSDCDKQNASYLQCRKSGYLHSQCQGQ